MTQKNFHKYFTLYFILFGIVISLFGAIISYNFQVKDIQKELDKKAKEISEIKIDSNLKQCLELKDKRQCPSCFAEIEKDVKFCPKCGAKQEEIQEEPAKEVEVIEKAEEQKENNQEDEKSTLETTVEVESNSNLDDDKTVEHISEENE